MYQWFVSAKTGSFKKGNNMLVLICDSYLVKAGIFSVVHFFCFGD